MAAQINAQLESNTPAALSFEIITVAELRNLHADRAVSEGLFNGRVALRSGVLSLTV